MSYLQLTAVHAKYRFLEVVRIPIVIIGTMVFPALALLFFVVPMETVAGDPHNATQAAVGMSFFAVMTNYLFTFGTGVADDRGKPWDPYLRTLPVGAGPQISARLVNGMLWSMLALVPVLVVAATLTEATVSPPRFLFAGVVLALGSLPFLFGGLAIGYTMTAKAALAVAQVAMFGMAFAGGLFMPPQMFPAWLDRLSAFLPSRGGRDLLEWAAMGGTLPLGALLCVVLWTMALAALAVWAYQRDEGRRFR